jgi:hypothetical protein
MDRETERETSGAPALTKAGREWSRGVNDLSRGPLKSTRDLSAACVDSLTIVIGGPGSGGKRPTAEAVQALSIPCVTITASPAIEPATN